MGTFYIQNEQDWVWHDWMKLDADERAEWVQKYPECGAWLTEYERRKANYTEVYAHRGEDNALCGTLTVCQDLNRPDRLCLVHYYISSRMLITIGLSENLFTRTTHAALLEKLQQVENATEGFMLILGELINTYLDGMDEFELELMKLERRMQERNGLHVLDEIINRRFELLRRTSITMPLREILCAAEEAFEEQVTEKSEYKRTEARLRRITMLEQHYEQEVEKLLRIDDNITNYRGNDIMKTLTVFTVVCTPVMSFGALWGMNFKFMPELEWKWGYAGSIGLILASTLAVYYWMRYKGWTGDILRGRRKDSNIK
ncbi:magnesium transporter CorA family protein [Paenibacillus sp. GCM10023252]|uniref:magnesium transporter CorA family protein n=1 Tax=Paenibacillus sp. GCM10023252 TaxID=3252649 RepID=UPI00361D94EA